MLTDTHTCEVVLPGYVLTERIGSGGYAEVWRAEAPGGIAKAVKIVYGHYDDELASQELKALERVKGVRHPFLLSLERFEIANGRLAILTELADMSLEQRLRQCRAEGLPGIPRDELLRYVADAAEALDFLSQRHNLLHLDIKPENLLVLGDHIKVADFGLVKELAARTQNSLVSGMTPTYAAPEMFDDEPTIHSDQYSLAIVYQEMLVGDLPFPGRTAAQLAKQHTLSAPQLHSLPEDDKPVVARALAKNPTDRYPSCRAFVDALIHRRETSPNTTPVEMPRRAPVSVPVSPSKPDDTKPPSYCTTIRRPAEPPREQHDPSVTQPIHRDDSTRLPMQATPATSSAPAVVDEDTTDVSVPATNANLQRPQPTLYIAIGGTGIQVLCRLRNLLSSAPRADVQSPAHESIALDTNRDEIREACSSRWKSPLNPEDTLHLPLRLPQDYDNSREILSWVSRRWLYNIPRSLETRGYRPLGRIALVDHAARVRALLDQKLARLATVAADESQTDYLDPAIKVVLLAGTGGGTGAGTVIDVANAVRTLAAARDLNVEVHGMLLFNCFGQSASAPLMAANSYSLLTELSHATAHGNKGTGESAMHSELFESQNSPFDHLYWVPARADMNNHPSADIRDVVANCLNLETVPEVRAVFRSCRLETTPREQTQDRALRLKKFGLASLADYKRSLLDHLSLELADAVKRHWLRDDSSENWEHLVKQQSAVPPAENGIGPTQDDPANLHAEVVTTNSPLNSIEPLALRARFQDYKSLEFTSELLRRVRHQLESRDDRGKPLLLAKEAVVVADAARELVAALARRDNGLAEGSSRFADSPALVPLIAAGSRRVLSRLVESVDAAHPERTLSLEVIDELVSQECRALLEEGLGQPAVAAAMATLIDSDQAAIKLLECIASGPVRCGSDRRTLVCVPQGDAQNSTVGYIKTKRPLAAVVPTTLDDVVVVVEETGIAPQSIARGLEHVFPGVADAARRLHARIDVPWPTTL